MSGIRRIRIKVRGRVQGVGFRYFALQAARRRKLTGYVMNESSGHVLIEAQGQDALVEDFLQDVKFGPSSAQVEDVNVDILDIVKTEHEFSIQPTR